MVAPCAASREVAACTSNAMASAVAGSQPSPNAPVRRHTGSTVLPLRTPTGRRSQRQMDTGPARVRYVPFDLTTPT
jgi:hypothetical protein